MAVVFSATAAAQDANLVITHPSEGSVRSGSSNIIYMSSGNTYYDQWRVTVGSNNNGTGLFDSGVLNLFPNELDIGVMPTDGVPVTMRVSQRFVGGSWVSFDTQYSTELLDEPEPPAADLDLAFISWPSAGYVFPSSSSTFYLVPGKTRFNQWRITLGAGSATQGLFDSGVLSQFPWEQRITVIPTDGQDVTMRIWQRQTGGEWATLDTAYQTSATATAPTPEPVPDPISEPEPVSPSDGETVLALTAVHNSGQTFLTWTEMAGDVGYHVYRHTSPISQSNLSSATKLTERWGPLDADTSVNVTASDVMAGGYVIKDLQPALSYQQGLFVHTTARSGAAYYAVTSVVNGSESKTISARDNSLANAVNESVNTPAPVLAFSTNGGLGRVYTQYMDYANWNPTHSGYAYNYNVALPSGYNPSQSYPLSLSLHAYGGVFTVKDQAELGWEVIQVFPEDPGHKRNTVHSWWYGYSADHNYITGGQNPTSGTVANFTEQRVMKAISEVIANPDFNVSTDKVSAYGHSMGGSGVFSLGIRYGNILAGVYANEGMTNYRANPMFQAELTRLWGSQSANLPIVNSGPYSSIIQPYSGLGVWDWMNHQEQLVNRRAEPMAYLMIAHGKADSIIDWYTQGEPLIRAFTQAKVGYSAHSIAYGGHAWLGFAAVVETLFGFGYGDDFPWKYPLDTSFPSITNASGSGSLYPGLTQTDDYNLNIEWATTHTPFAPAIIDQAGRYEISLRSLENTQTADITPRKTQSFNVTAGERCTWVTTDNNTSNQISSGSATVDSAGLLTVPNVSIRTESGTRLAIRCS